MNPRSQPSIQTLKKNVFWVFFCQASNDGKKQQNLTSVAKMIEVISLLLIRTL